MKQLRAAFQRMFERTEMICTTQATGTETGTRRRSKQQPAQVSKPTALSNNNNNSKNDSNKKLSNCANDKKAGNIPVSAVDIAGTRSVESVLPRDMADAVQKAAAVVMCVYSLYSLFSLVAWVSHLGERVPFMQRLLLAKGYASNPPVHDMVSLFTHNLFNSFLFLLPHSLLRPPTLKKYVGHRHARLLYCFIAGLGCHILTANFTPLSSPILFTLPVPKLLHDILSISMLLFSALCVVFNKDTYVILGFNSSYFGPESKKCVFPTGLSPRMDIITWMGYATWLVAGDAGFVLFSGLSILPYEVYTWDIVTRVVAASYLRVRSQGFRIWVGKIESTHHFIWVLRGVIMAAALVLKSYWTAGNGELGSDSEQSGGMKIEYIIGLSAAAIATAVLMDKLEKTKSSSPSDK